MNMPTRLAWFVREVGDLLESPAPEAELLRGGEGLLRQLVAHDDWLPAAYAAPDPKGYRQYLLYRRPGAAFTVVSFVWGPNQGTPIHDHTVWGLVGVLRGLELSQRFSADGRTPPVPLGPPQRLQRGEVEAVSPAVGDVHRVENGLKDAVSVSIHLYGADIGAVQRWTYPPEGGRKAFISGYANGPGNPPYALG